MKPYEIMQKMSLPYEAKIRLAKRRAREFYEHEHGQVFCSVGGLDSITLFVFLKKYISDSIPGVSVSSLEDKSIQKVHLQLGVTTLKPTKSKVEIIKNYGYPVLSKGKAMVIEMWQNPTTRNLKTRLQSLNQNGGSHKFKLNKLEQALFVKQSAPFAVSPKCCYYLKEKPCDSYSRETGRAGYMGLMASDGGQRELALTKNGCNYYGKTVTRSCPFAIFTKSDLLRLALELEVPIPEIYGEIVQLPDGTLTTAKATRTGCTMCGFGVHMEHRPHRFDRLREANPKEWNFWMYDMGWGEVLSYIGVEWESYVSVQGELIPKAKSIKNVND